MITRKVAGAIAAGCAIVLKPAAETPYSALALAELGERAGVPKGLFNVVTTNERVQEVGTAITTYKDVKRSRSQDLPMLGSSSWRRRARL